MNGQQEFRGWLIEAKHLTPKSASDVISRCQRIEKVFAISFYDHTRSDAGANGVADRIRVLVSAGQGQVRKDLLRALRRYTEFNSPGSIPRVYSRRRSLQPSEPIQAYRVNGI